MDMSGWDKIKEANGVMGFTRPSGESDFKTFKAEFYVNKPPNWVGRYIFDNFPELNREFQNDDLEHIIEIRSINENMHVHEVAVKPIGPAYGRELQTVGVYLPTGENQFTEVGVSVTKQNPLRPGYCEAELIFGVSNYAPVGDDTNRTHVQAIVLVDPKGNVPAFAANALMGNRTVFYEKLRDRLNSL